jgi:hypothetical protein
VIDNITTALILIVDVNTLDTIAFEPVIAIELNPCRRMPLSRYRRKKDDINRDKQPGAQ